MSGRPFDFEFRKIKTTESIDYARNISKRDYFAMPLKMGNVHGFYWDSLEQLLFCHFERADYLLDLASRLVDVVLAENEPHQLALPPDRFIIKALCIWHYGNRNDAAWWKQAYEAEELHGSEWVKEGAPPQLLYEVRKWLSNLSLLLLGSRRPRALHGFD